MPGVVVYVNSGAAQPATGHLALALSGCQAPCVSRKHTPVRYTVYPWIAIVIQG
jgi:hypothetical protein